MRHSIITLFLIMLFLSKLTAEELTIGAGAYFQTQPYKNCDAIIVPSPVIFYDNGIVYARWTRFGVYFYGSKEKNLQWGFSLTAQPRPNGYKPSDSPDLEGLDEKKSSFEGGLAYTIYSQGKYLEAMLLTDLLGRYDSYIAKVEIGMKQKIANVSLYPSLIGVYESKKFTDYYYGISDKEAARTSYLPYNPSGGLRVAAQTYINYPLTKKWSAFFNLRIDRLTNNAKNSPIVSDSLVYSGLASLLYTFD